MILDINYCEQIGILRLFKYAGYIIFIVKVLVPLILIINGSISFGKAVIESDDKAIKTASNTILRSAIAGVVIFFIPTLLNTIFSLIDDAVNYTKTEKVNPYYNCQTCLFNPTKKGCTTAIKKAKETIEQPGIK